MVDVRPDDAIPDDLVEVGRVSVAHGVRGGLKVQPYSPQAEALLNAPVWWLKAPDSLLEAGALSRPHRMQVQSRRLAGQWVLAQLSGIADRDAADSLRAHTVWVPRAAFPAAAADEYYWVDLIGCDFYGRSASGDSVLLGRVDQVLDNGAHAILQITCGAPDQNGVFLARQDGKGRPVQVLVPFVEAHVQRVDLPGRRIDSDWPADF